MDEMFTKYPEWNDLCTEVGETWIDTMYGYNESPEILSFCTLISGPVLDGKSVYSLTPEGAIKNHEAFVNQVKDEMGRVV